MTRESGERGYARRPIWDWLTPDGRVKVAIALACVIYLACWCALMAR